MRMFLLGFLLALLSAGMVAAWQIESRTSIKDFMRPKLTYSQRVLEGLALEDFGLIAENASKLTRMSEMADWQVLPGPQYARYSAEFQRLSSQLTRQAREKNLDVATLTYVQITMNCVECHRHVRHVKAPDQGPKKKPQSS